MGQEGYFLVHRKIQDCWIWTSDEPFDRRSAWIDLIMMANHKDVKLLFDGNLITVERGQRITSIRSLAERWKWGKAKVTEFLRLLENDGMIKKDSDKRRTLLTIVNYEVYQLSPDSERTVSGHSQGQCTDSHRTQTINDNNENNENKSISITNVIDCEDKSSREEIEKVLEMWNSLPTSIPKVQRLISGKNRYKQLKARLGEYSLAEVSDAIENIKESDFLQGKNSRGWTITFDWFVKPNNFPKVLDGQYSNRAGMQNASLDDYMMSVISGGEE